MAHMAALPVPSGAHAVQVTARAEKKRVADVVGHPVQFVRSTSERSDGRAQNVREKLVGQTAGTYAEIFG